MKTRDVIPLLVKMTPEEQRVRGLELADAHRELDVLNMKKKVLGKEIESQNETIEKLTTAVHYCQEERPVEVEYKPDLEADTMTTIRLDTGEIVAVRMLDGNERRSLKEPVLTLNGKTMDSAETWLGITYAATDGRQVGILMANASPGFEACAKDAEGNIVSFEQHTLPVFETAAEAQSELDKYAKKAGLAIWLDVPAADTEPTADAASESTPEVLDDAKE